MKKLIPNPAYESAPYKLDYIWHGGPPKFTLLPEVRTNNPRYLIDGTPADLIPSHVEVEG